MRTTTKTWICPACDACTVSDARPGVCAVCRKQNMVLWNIAETVSPYSVSAVDWPRSRWEEDRREVLCVFCNGPLSETVALVLRVGLSFPVGAACEACALQEAT